MRKNLVNYIWDEPNPPTTEVKRLLHLWYLERGIAPIRTVSREMLIQTPLEPRPEYLAYTKDKPRERKGRES